MFNFQTKFSSFYLQHSQWNCLQMNVIGPYWVVQWASCQIRKIAGYACAGSAGNVFPATSKETASQRSRHASRMCPWCMSGSLTLGGGKTFPAFPAHAQNLRIWQEAHDTIYHVAVVYTIFFARLHTWKMYQTGVTLTKPALMEEKAGDVFNALNCVSHNHI